LTQELFTRWIENLYATQDHEVDCRQFQNHLPAFVEAELNNTRLPHTAVLATHLRQCPDCNEIYQGLRLVALAEATETFPSNQNPTQFPSLSTGD